VCSYSLVSFSLYTILTTKRNNLKRGDRRARQNKYSGQPRGSTRMSPPQIRSNIVVTHKYRFTSSSGTATAITSRGLLLACGAMCSVPNVTVSAIAGSVRVNHVSVWSPPASQGAFATCSVEFLGQTASSTQEVSDTSVSVAQPACISTAPPRASLASFWQTPGLADNTMFTLVAPTGSIIDMDLSFILWDNEDAATTRAVTAGTLGTIYYLALDNATGHIYPPVSLNTTF